MPDTASFRPSATTAQRDWVGVEPIAPQGSGATSPPLWALSRSALTTLGDKREVDQRQVKDLLSAADGTWVNATATLFSSLDATGLPDARFSSGMPITKDALLAKARCLVPSAAFVGEVLPLMSPDTHASQDLIRQLESDPAALMLVLRIANAPGPRTSDLVTALSISSRRVFDAFRAAHALAPPPIQAPYEERIRYWQIAVAVCARTIASYLDDTDRDAAYCAAMLSGMGRYIFATSIPAQYAEIVEQASLSECPLAEVERGWVEFDNLDLLACIATDFQLPTSLRLALGHKDSASAIHASTNNNLLPSVVCLAWELEAHLRRIARGTYSKGSKKRLAKLATTTLSLSSSVLDGIIEESRWACFERGDILVTEPI